jgi:hypothetical protein
VTAGGAGVKRVIVFGVVKGMFFFSFWKRMGRREVNWYSQVKFRQRKEWEGRLRCGLIFDVSLPR